MARPTLYTHRKFTRLIAILGLSKAQVLGHLEFLWHVAYESATDYIGDSLDVEIAAEWTGERGVLTAALLQVRFIDQSDEGFRLHDFWTHAPSYVRRRQAREQARKANDTPLTNQRLATDEPEDSQCSIIGSHSLLPTPGPRPPAPSTQHPKNREVIKNTEVIFCAESKIDSTQKYDDPICQYLIETWKDIKDPNTLVKAAKEACPGVDLLAKAKEANAWEVANPKRRKTNHSRFLMNWWKSSQDKVFIQPQTKFQPYSKPQTEEVKMDNEERFRILKQNAANLWTEDEYNSLILQIKKLLDIGKITDDQYRIICDIADRRLEWSQTRR